MGHRAYVDVIENGKITVLYAHWGANDMTIVSRLWDAYKIKKQWKLKNSFADILSSIEYEGDYNPGARLSSLVFNKCDAEETAYSKLSFEDLGDIEMKITLDLDRQTITYHYDLDLYGDNFSSYEVPILAAFKALKRVNSWADKKGLDEFWEIAHEFRKEIRAVA